MKAYLSVTEIAQVAKKERSTIVRWIKMGKLGKIRKIGNEYQVPHESFKRWWEKRLKAGKPSERNK